MGTVGRFNWIDMLTTDRVAGAQFYGSLFDWTAEDSDGGDHGVYTMFSSGGAVVAGMGEYDPDQQAMGLPPVWHCYVTVADAEAACAKGIELGAEIVVPVTPVDDAGRFAMLSDPTGAAFGIWQDGAHTGAEKLGEPASLMWTELATANTDSAESFYGQLFGWSTSAQEMGDGLVYTVFLDEEQPVAGMYDMKGIVPPEVLPHWMPYIMVSDVAASLESVDALGGSLANGPLEVPDVGTMAIIRDPQGGAICILEPPSHDDAQVVEGEPGA